jgi:hypothetical protein
MLPFSRVCLLIPFLIFLDACVVLDLYLMSFITFSLRKLRWNLFWLFDFSLYFSIFFQYFYSYDRLPRLSPEEFEKDDDSNHHIDWITAASTLRGIQYSLKTISRTETKRCVLFLLSEILFLFIHSFVVHFMTLGFYWYVCLFVCLFIIQFSPCGIVLVFAHCVVLLVKLYPLWPLPLQPSLDWYAGFIQNLTIVSFYY